VFDRLLWLESWSLRRVMSARVPAYGVGIGYRYCIHREIMRCASMIDFIEIPSGDYADDERRARFDPDESKLREATAKFPSVAHGTDLSIGTSAPPDSAYLARVADFAERTPIAEYSDHLAFIRGIDREVDAFMALPFTDLGVAIAVENVKRAKRAIGLPFLIENVSYYFALPGATMGEAEFIKRIAEQADCGILLDVANLWINAANHKYDPLAFLRELPPERVLHAHFCGATRGPDAFFYDTHCEVTMPPVWNLIDEALRHTSLRALVFERDQRFVPFQEPMEEIFKARELFRRHRKPKQDPPPVKRDPQPIGGDDSIYSAELRRLQEVTCRLLLEPELGRAVEREGEVALVHTGIDLESRRLLAAIEPRKRERIGRRLREALAKSAGSGSDALP